MDFHSHAFVGRFIRIDVCLQRPRGDEASGISFTIHGLNFQLKSNLISKGYFRHPLQLKEVVRSTQSIDNKVGCKIPGCSLSEDHVGQVPLSYLQRAQYSLSGSGEQPVRYFWFSPHLDQVPSFSGLAISESGYQDWRIERGYTIARDTFHPVPLLQFSPLPPYS